MNAQQLIQQAEDAAFRSNDLGTVYMIQPGDTLSEIISAHYGVTVNSLEYNIAMNSAIAFNDRIEEGDYIRAGEAIRLMPLPDLNSSGFCPTPADFYKEKQIVTRHKLEPMRSHHSAYVRDMAPRDMGVEQDIYRALALIQEHYLWLNIAGTTGAEAFGQIAGAGNVALAQQVGSLYEDYKNNKLTKGQYDGRRAKLLKEMSKNLGPLEKILLGGKTAKQAIRINRFKSLPVTHNISAYASHLGQLASRATTGGGILLAGMGGAVACADIADADTRQEKNEVFVEYGISTSTSAVLGIAVSALLLTTPVGWGVALVLGAGTAAWGKLAGDGAAWFYNKKLQHIDLVSDLGIDKVC